MREREVEREREEKKNERNDPTEAHFQFAGGGKSVETTLVHLTRSTCGRRPNLRAQFEIQAQ